MAAMTGTRQATSRLYFLFLTVCSVTGCISRTNENSIALDTVPQGMAIVGHRGASDDAPENTLESMKLAWQQGATAAECDIVLTKDGEIVLMHDDSTKRTALGGIDLLVGQAEWAKLRELDVGSFKGEKWKGVKIPRLVDVLRVIPEGRRLFIEIKSGNMNTGADQAVLPALVELLSHEKIAPSAVTIISFDHNILAKLKMIAPQYQAFYLTTFVEYPGNWPYMRTDADLEKMIQTAKAAHIDGIDMENSSVISAAWVEKIHAAQLKTAIWSYKADDTVANAQKYRAMGVGYYTTNAPGVVRRELGVTLGG